MPISHDLQCKFYSVAESTISRTRETADALRTEWSADLQRSRNTALSLGTNFDMYADNLEPSIDKLDASYAQLTKLLQGIHTAQLNAQCTEPTTEKKEPSTSNRPVYNRW